MLLTLWGITPEARRRAVCCALEMGHLPSWYWQKELRGVALGRTLCEAHLQPLQPLWCSLREAGVSLPAGHGLAAVALWDFWKGPGVTLCHAAREAVGGVKREEICLCSMQRFE